VGVHGRNDYWECKFEERDYQLIREARIEHVKMMISDQAGANPQVLTNAVEVCNRLVGINSEMDLVVRLDDPHRVRFHPELKVPVHPTPQEFANRSSMNPTTTMVDGDLGWTKPATSPHGSVKLAGC
jgi:hypothetical protein